VDTVNGLAILDKVKFDAVEGDEDEHVERRRFSGDFRLWNNCGGI
jgi:hypothetical protein